MGRRMIDVRHAALILACGLLTGASDVPGTIHGQVLRAPAASLADFVVSVEDLQGGFSSPKDVAFMDQKELKFVPHVLVIPVGTTVEFPNSDIVSHNVFSISPAKRFNLGLYVRGTIRRITFDQPGIVELLCNVHLDMSGYIVVLANPYFSRVAPDGTYRITGVPPGRHRLRCWSDSIEPQEVEVEVRPGAVVHADFSAHQ
jgi:plastocyanin